jgi:8-oxo-dGTP pyrophosphatase MutT (NUDIX family)
MIDNLRRKLANLNRKSLSDTKLIPSAVILPIYFKNGEYHILFVKRTQTVKDHKGQISFPGGRHETCDKTLLETALRECEEEVGLPKEKLEILGELDECATRRTKYRIATFVSLILYPFEFKPDRCEIERIIEIPVSALIDEWKTTDAPTTSGVPEYYYDGERIWGATAIILTQLLEILEAGETPYLNVR